MSTTSGATTTQAAIAAASFKAANSQDAGVEAIEEIVTRIQGGDLKNPPRPLPASNRASPADEGKLKMLMEVALYEAEGGAGAKKAPKTGSEELEDEGAIVELLMPKIGYRGPREHAFPLASDFEPGPNDVICAKGKQAFNHTGNRRFREIIDLFLPRYYSQSKLTKTLIIGTIVGMINEHSQTPGNAFVRLNGDRNWECLSDAHCREKVGQSLRAAFIELNPRKKAAKAAKRAINRAKRRLAELTKKTDELKNTPSDSNEKDAAGANGPTGNTTQAKKEPTKRSSTKPMQQQVQYQRANNVVIAPLVMPMMVPTRATPAAALPPEIARAMGAVSIPPNLPPAIKGASATASSPSAYNVAAAHNKIAAASPASTAVAPDATSDK